MRFANPDPAHAPHSARAIFRWMVLDPLRGRRKVQPAGAPAPRIEPDLDRIHSVDGTLRATWIGHSSFLCTLNGHNVLFDPVFSRRIAVLVPRYGEPGLMPGQLPELSCILISHNHYDHLDRASLEALPRDVTAYVPAGMGVWFRRWHRRRPVVELDWWETRHHEGLEITLVPARHWSRRRVFDTNRQLWGGFVVRAAGRTLYHAGDSAWFDGFTEIAERFPEIDLAMLPIGAYLPPWFMEHHHMNPEQAVQAFETLGARWMIPMHWGAFQLTDEPISEPAERLASTRAVSDGGDGGVALLAVGETLELDDRLHRVAE